MEQEQEVVTLSPAEAEEFKQWKHSTQYAAIQESIKATTNLVDDVDVPLRNVVAMLNLLGCKTIWSCCGFDYVGQPLHKSHEYGSIYIRIGFNEDAYALGFNLLKQRLPAPWKVTFAVDGELQLKAEFRHTGHLKMWDDINCPHYSEGAAFAIYNLEQRLIYNHHRFREQVTIEDTNQAYKMAYENWQYIPKQPWTVTKAEIMAKFEAKQKAAANGH